ncbi:unnamed protein product [Sphagnum jensenii]|uniref:Uncharacterized protein n=1 Tax=Sphagnum jensenii TaxID=128206 RepID=A0ABP1BWX6_9BRYO
MMNSNAATSLKKEKEMNENSPPRWRNFAAEKFRRNCGFRLRLRALGNLQSGQGARRREIHNAHVCAGGRAGGHVTDEQRNEAKAARGVFAAMARRTREGGRAGTSPMSNATRRRQRAVCSQRWRGGPEEDGGEPRH